MNPIEEYPNLWKRIINRFRKKKEKTVDIHTSNPYRNFDEQMKKSQQSWNDLGDAIVRAGLSTQEAAQALRTNMSEVNKWKNLK